MSDVLLVLLVVAGLYGLYVWSAEVYDRARDIVQPRPVPTGEVRVVFPGDRVYDIESPTEFVQAPWPDDRW